MKLEINESLSSSEWIDIIESNRDKLVNELIDLGKDACGSYQKDLYLWDDGRITVFDNVGGNSWINSDDYIVVWSTRGYEYDTIEDLADIDTDDFIRILNDYTSDDVNDYVTTWLYLNTDAPEYYDTVDEYIHRESNEVRQELIKHYPEAYNDMTEDLANDIFDTNWADDIIDMRIEELKRDLHRR